MVRVNRKTGVLILAVLLCLFSFASAALAQKATLTGKVTDNEAGEALPGANVVVSNAEIQTGAATKSSGEFTVRNLPEGTYTVTVSYIGYGKNVIENVEVSAGETKNLDIVLAITGIEINPISITASKREEKSMEAPASISVLEAREISEQVVMSSAEMLKNVPGIDLSTTGVDRREIVLRGFNNAFSGAAYILTDYRQAAVPSLNVNLHSIMPNMSIDLERIEIVRGPGSALYGAGVDAGVIHYFTKDPFNYPGTTFSFGGGERSSIAGQFRHAGVAGKLGYKITGQYAKANDWELNANNPLDLEQLQADAQDATGNPLNPRNYDYKKFNVNGLLQYRFNDKTSLTAAGGYAALDAVILSGIGTLQADNFGYSYGQLRLQAGRFFAQAYLNKNDAGDSFVYGTGQKVVDKSTLLNLQAQYDFEFSENQQLIVGVDYDRTTPDTEGTIFGRNEDRDLVSETGVFAQSSMRISPKLNLTLGARADYNNIQDDFQFSPRVAVVLKPTPSHSFRATYNRAFASPGQNQNFLDIVAGQIPGTDILVRGRGSAFGFEFDRDPTFAAFAGSDLIAYSLNPATLGMPQPVGLPLDATYQAFYDTFSQIPLATLRQLLPPPFNQLPDAQLAGLVGLFDPSLTQVNGFSKGALGVLNLSTLAVNPIADVADISALTQTITQTLEVGYKGLLGDRMLVAIDGYYENKKDFVGPLLIETPFVFVPTLTADLQAALATGITNNPQLAGLLGSVGSTPEDVAALLVALASAQLPDATTPVAIVSPSQNAPEPGETPELMLAYRNFGNVDLFGIDLSLQYLASDRLSFFGNLSWVNDDFFDNKELDESNTSLALALNAPTFKSKVGFNYSVPFGISLNAAARYTEGFPVLSGPYVGDVDNYFLFDIGAGYDLGRYAAGMRFDIAVTNLFDNEHREFIGAPEIGRMAMARISYTLR